MDVEPITILTPVYGRNKFFSLWLNNIVNQDYPHDKIEVIIDECIDNETTPFMGDQLEMIRKAIHPIKINHFTTRNRRTIGEKRNNLIKLCKTKIFCFMDSDDLYYPTYLSYSYQMLKENNVKLVGSDKMTFTYINNNFKLTKIDCGDQIVQIHEATIMSYKKFFNSTCKFKRNSAGEGKNLFSGLKDKDVFISDVDKIMICICHEDNTVNKDRFKDQQIFGNMLPEIIEYIKEQLNII